VEAGKLDIVIDAMNTAELPLQMRLQFDLVAEQKDLEFVVEYEDSLPDIFYTDEQRLHQIVRNLLSNAFKFTEQGSVTMRLAKPSEEQLRSLSLHQYASDEAWLALSVQDTGIGIAEDKRAIIFEAFQQADGRTSRKYGGTGLGLSICRELSRLLGGKVFVDSEEGVGSTFTVIIPSLPPKGDTAAEEDHVLLQAAAASEAAEIERPEVLMRDAEQLAMLELVEDAGVHRPFAGKRVLV
ncbi:ATP-binding protein, partial [Citrobacter arsenatis]|uniref:ATP-binding protein n=1 Tax=Citrobacter arsenatis TaxID=2546350 RepID=UPI003D7F9C4E